MIGHSHAALTRQDVWNLLFAREPEADLDLDLEPETDPSVDAPGVGSPGKTPEKPPRIKPWVIILLLVTVAGGTYLASDPTGLLELIGQGPPSSSVPPSSPAPEPARPNVPMPAPSPTSPGPSTPASIPSPLFREGQRVMVRLDPALPGGIISMSGDAEGATMGPAIRAGAAVTVLDAELQNTVWIYAVRTEDGAHGWITEGRLTEK